MISVCFGMSAPSEGLRIWVSGIVCSSVLVCVLVRVTLACFYVLAFLNGKEKESDNVKQPGCGDGHSFIISLGSMLQ